jgi:hypothetical protein
MDGNLPESSLISDTLSLTQVNRPLMDKALRTRRLAVKAHKKPGQTITKARDLGQSARSGAGWQSGLTDRVEVKILGVRIRFAGSGVGSGFRPGGTVRSDPSEWLTLTKK